MAYKKRKVTRNKKKTTKRSPKKKATKPRTANVKHKKAPKRRNAPAKSPSSRQTMSKLEEDLSFVEGALSAAKTKGQKQDLRKLRDELKEAIREKVGRAIERDTLPGLRQKSGELTEAIRGAETAGQKSMYRALKKRVDVEIRKRAKGPSKKASKKRTVSAAHRTARGGKRRGGSTRQGTAGGKKKTAKKKTAKRKTAKRRVSASRKSARTKKRGSGREKCFTAAEIKKIRSLTAQLRAMTAIKAGDTPEIKRRKKSAKAALRKQLQELRSAAACRLGQQRAREAGQEVKRGKCKTPPNSPKQAAKILGYARAREAGQKAPSPRAMANRFLKD